jgi:hypothetical protein
MRNFPVLLVAVALVLFTAGCGGGSSPTPAPRVVSISISPTTASLKAGATQFFFATVHGTGNIAVAWQVNGTVGGDSTVGTISTGGLYQAPSNIPSPATVTVTAISQADTSKTASSSVTITLGVTVAPNAATLNIGGPVCTSSQTFTAQVTGSGNTAVDWSVNGTPSGDSVFGTVDAAGLYTAPNAIPDPLTFKLTATSQADPTQFGNATLTIQAGGPGINRAGQPAPVKLGTTGGNVNDETASFCCSGTLGSLMTRSGTNYVLSNNHVLARSGHAVVGEHIGQPGLVDNACSPGMTVANFSQAVKLNPGGTSLADAAMAQVVSGQVDTTGAILGLGAVSCGVAQPAPPANTVGVPAIGMKVAKSGRTSGLTCGTIAFINVAVAVQYENSCGSNSTFIVNYDNQVEIDSPTFSAPGDSGSLIVNSATAEPVALLYAGDPSSTIANPIQDVLSGLADSKGVQPTFVGGATHTVDACTGAQGSNAKAPRLTTATVMSLSDAEIARASAAKNAHAKALMADPAIIGVGVGAGDTPGEAVVVIFVNRDKPHGAIPATLDGVKTKVKLVKQFKAYSGACPAGHDDWSRRLSTLTVQ